MTQRADQLHHDNALSCRFYLAKNYITLLCQTPPPPIVQMWLPTTFGFFPKIKIAFEIEEICECDGHAVHKLSQRRLTAN